uniref:Tetratricopeptide repeat domain 21A n=1 Tax=Suricata suricatta TaxID=37032 RepID=A0A673TV40_SURSU
RDWQGAGIIYYSRERYFRHVQQAAASGLGKFSNDPVLQFFKTYGLLREGKNLHIQDAIGSLENIRNHPDVSLCSVMALIYAHKCCETVDQEAVWELESSLKDMRKTASGTALYYAGLFLWLVGRGDKAKDYVDRALRVCSGLSQVHVLRGWVDLTSDKPHAVKRSIKYLEQGTQDTNDVLGLMGKVGRGGFLPALVLKMRLFLAQQDWEQAVEMGPAKGTPASDAALRRQAGPTGLRVPIARSLQCGRHQAVLRPVCGFIERTFMATASPAHVATELGYLFVLQDQVKEASLWYSEAMKLDESSVAALTGIIWCQILEGHLEEAEQQLEFLKEVQQSLGKSEVLVFLQGLLASRRHRGEQEAAPLLKEAAELHFSGVQGLPLGTEYLEKLDPLFLVCIARELLLFCPKQPRAPGQIVSPLLKQVAVILSPVVKVAPALIEPLYLMAQVKYLSGELETAQSTLQRCLELDPSCVDVHLLTSHVYLAQGNFAMCSHSLELGVSHNFQVRDHPLYHFIKARVLSKCGDYPGAIKTLRMIMKLPARKAEEGRKARGPSTQPGERLSILLELVDALRKNGQLHEATKVMQDAINEFSGTPEEVRITIANVDLALSNGNVDMALSMLRNITPKQPCYVEAKEKMADIYLQTRKDTSLYIGCYRELCEHLPGPHTSLLLGDAFMNIQEPEKALEAYDDAYRKNPHDAFLVSRMGQAYVKTHQYSKAINYYEAAQKMNGQDFLCCDLAALLLKVKKFNKAEKVLKHALEQDVGEAMELQAQVLKRVALEQPEMTPAQRQLAASICVQCGDWYLAEKDFAKAGRSYKDALFYSPEDSKVGPRSQRLRLLLCPDALQSPPGQVSGALRNPEAAITLYRQVLEKAPDNFLVWNKLIDLLWRNGRLDDAPTFFELVKRMPSRVVLEPGFNYCRGIYCWHVGQPNEALRFLNKARKDSTWGLRATYYMVQICLNPDNEVVGGEVFQNLGGARGRGPKKGEESEQHAVRTAEKLLRDLSPLSARGQTQLRLLQSLCLLATREKANVEAALGTFVEMAQAEKDSVPALLAMAQAYALLKQVPKARTQLKRLAKAPWTPDEAEDLERGWLLLADIYCQGGKFDLASELLRRCVHCNKSCFRAYEYMGFIMEKEQSYKDAAANYELAWKYSHQANPAVGFKLAFNYLKDKRFVEAIEVCHTVLREHPNYPQIREEILEKAQGSLRL